MNAIPRNFEVKPAVRIGVPLLVGIMGPSGGGKTFSALRLATGIQQARGGDIFMIDTEAKRALHYADRFKFQHLQFDAPFGSLDYLAAIKHCVAKGAGVVIIDSMSHEHESTGGMLDMHDQEVTRMAGDDWAKRERVKMLAWQKPKAARRQLINGLLQINANFIFCFRAKETSKPVKKDGKTEVVAMGFTPIAGDEFVYEMTVNCLLLPNAKGVPTWASDAMGERQMIKLPEQFRGIFADQKPLSEDIGRALADWAKGGAASSPKDADAAIEAARAAARNGSDAFAAWWKAAPADDRAAAKTVMDDIKVLRELADAERSKPTEIKNPVPEFCAADAHDLGSAHRVKGGMRADCPKELSPEHADAWRAGFDAADEDMREAKSAS